MSRSSVQHFLQRAHTALKGYGGGINPVKTRYLLSPDIDALILYFPNHLCYPINMTFYMYGSLPFIIRVNFDSEIEYEGRRITLTKVPTQDMTWNGFLINTRTLEVRPYCIDSMLSRVIEFTLH